jgi:amino acid adenylation domain-containing protein
VRSLLELLQRGLERDPAAVAVSASEEVLTWTELDQKSAGVAGWLVEAGLQPGARVALLSDRSVEAVVAIFGIWRAGGAYVPLDPLCPPERNRVLISDSGARWLLTRKKWMRRAAPLVAYPDGPGIAEIGSLANRPASLTLPEALCRDEDLAALLYTSGSTGHSKGVMLSHRAILAFVEWAVARLELGPGDRVSGVSPLHFDLSTLEIFGALAAGAQVCIAPPGASAFPESLARFLAEQKISCWYSVPSVLMRLAEADLSTHDLSSLRQLPYAGEVFPSGALADLMRRIPEAHVHNFFGPTESNVCVAARVHEPPEEGTSIPIGTPASGARIRICGPDGGLVSPGERGELWVSGPSLMSGYWDDPEGSARALVNDAGDTWLRTGDEVHREDGQLWYHGRLDSMLKIDGFRLHPEEVERVICAQVGVRAAVVRKLDGRLHALVEAPGVDAEVLTKACVRSLPSYMRPGSLEVVDRLPRGVRGKLRR